MFEVMNENISSGFLRDVMTLKLEQIKASGGPSPLEQLLSTCTAIRKMHAGAARVLADSHLPVRGSAIFMGPTVPDVIFGGSVALPAMAAGGTTTMVPPLPADYLAEPWKLVISRQQFLIILITLIVLAMPAVVLTSDLSPDAQAVILAYDGVLAAYAAAYTFADRGKRK
jgi:hypothetical protein